ncbi:hypothetical protein QAD02_000227 [Eretmocerus hayati]|uniref:Uncharacterized protein n=1 Tax=Eretmocerus hayati TaxID=131215 RepID=A0ACC2NDD9_9HYME|nr:hypothetical protein QAD02_000227 [Eretmocerus hayati]
MDVDGSEPIITDSPEDTDCISDMDFENVNHSDIDALDLMPLNRMIPPGAGKNTISARSENVKRNAERVAELFVKKTLSLREMVDLIYKCRMILSRYLARTKNLSEMAEQLDRITKDRKFVSLTYFLRCTRGGGHADYFEADLVDESTSRISSPLLGMKNNRRNSCALLLS